MMSHGKEALSYDRASFLYIDHPSPFLTRFAMLY